ncbi:MAG: peptidoglycan editing factor PgeF [Patescibacteria group bacterium]
MNLVICQQTHSANTHVVTKEDIGKEISNCDGLITNLKNINLQIKTADCVPVTINDPVKKLVGVVHAGWRGTEKEIVKNAINLMINNFNSRPLDIKIKIGPAIDKNNYLVKKDVASRFIDKYPECLEKIDSEHWKFDLVGVNIKQLLDMGILNKNIKNSKISTFLNKKYPSFRRDGKSEGFVTSIMLK